MLFTGLSAELKDFWKFEFWNTFGKLPQNCLNSYSLFFTPCKG